MILFLIAALFALAYGKIVLAIALVIIGLLLS